MIAGCAGFVLLSYPTLVLMGSGHFWAAVAAMSILGVFMVVFGGITPYASTWLISATHNTYAPAFYIGAAALVSGVVFVLAHETAHEPLRSRTGE
jgi:MHS family proline/betaine transporter-like MFS transporter